jgi:hypothetical protein
LFFLPLVTALRDLPHHLVDLLVRLGARVRIIDTCHARHLVDERFREERSRHRSGRTREIVHFDELVTHRIGDALAAISDIDGPHGARHGVDVFLALGIPQPDPLAFDEDAGINGFVGLVLAQVMPDMGAVGLRYASEVVDIEGEVHCMSPGFSA